jgi:hypothetical protein
VKSSRKSLSSSNFLLHFIDVGNLEKKIAIQKKAKEHENYYRQKSVSASRLEECLFALCFVEVTDVTDKLYYGFI